MGAHHGVDKRRDKEWNEDSSGDNRAKGEDFGTRNQVHEMGSSNGTSDLLPLLDLDTFLHILSFVPGKDLIRRCRLVNKSWKEAVDGNHIWVNKLQRERNEIRPLEMELLPYHVNIKKLYMNGTFRKNLIKNWDGSSKSQHWNLVSEGGDGFQMEPASAPHGSKPLPPELGCVNCWATSYGNCIMTQTVDLKKAGCDGEWFDKIQPPIEVSEWVANRFDCAANYTMNVSLGTERKKPLAGNKYHHEYERRKPQWWDNGWEKHTYVFENYGPGVGCVIFEHKGVDGQFWAGHFGPKMAAPSVRLLPRPSEGIST